ncbi:MAG TPA: hypothetical protein VMP67_09380 [Candidatus Limnocylindria bacterium]|nr:hypothetical protein [Candidatus Limnocylindria bacterium]
MAAAVGLEQYALARHALTPAAVLGRATRAHRCHAGLSQHPAQGARRGGQLGPLLGQRLSQVDRVEAGVLLLGQLGQLPALLVGQPVDRLPATVAVDQRRGASERQAVTSRRS